MEKIIIEIPSPVDFSNLVNHLLPKGNSCEQAAFLHSRFEEKGDESIFKMIELDLVTPEALAFQSEFHLELGDLKRAQLIKKAHDLNACLTEWHSHPSYYPAAFSISDMCGFEEFVPHVRWRLKQRPYAAIVLAPRDFDALAWIKETDHPCQVDSIRVGSKEFFPTKKTLQSNNRGIY